MGRACLDISPSDSRDSRLFSRWWQRGITSSLFPACKKWDLVKCTIMINTQAEHKQPVTHLRENNTGHIAQGPAVLTEIRAEALHAGRKTLPYDGGGQNLKLLWTRWRAKNSLQLHHQIWWKPDSNGGGLQLFTYNVLKYNFPVHFWRVRQMV